MIFVYHKSLIQTFDIQYFDYKITSVNAQHENTNSKGDLVFKYRFDTCVLKISVIKKINLTKIWYGELKQ